MRLLELIDDIIVLAVVLKLLLELFDPLFKPLLRVHYLKPHVADFNLVVLLNLSFTILDLGFVLFELLLSLLTFLGVTLFDIADHSLDVGLLTGFLQGVFLTGDHTVGFSQDSFDFLLIGTS